MKLKRSNVILLVCLIIMGLSCKKKNENPIDNLPPLTTTGANTFGCLVNGASFIPKVNFGPRGALESNFDVANGKLFFSISARDNRQKKSSSSMALIVTADDLKEGQEYNLTSSKQGNSSASYYFIETTPKEYHTNDKVIGKVYLKYFDKKIASGTFWFDAVSDAGEKVEIREGRFDVRF